MNELCEYQNARCNDKKKIRDIWPCFCDVILSTSYEITRKKKLLSDKVNVVKKRRNSNTWQFYTIPLRDLSLYFVTRRLNSEWRYICAHLFQEKSVWDLRWTTWQRDRIFFFLWALRFSPVSIIPPMLLSHSPTYHRCYMTSLTCETIQKKNTRFSGLSGLTCYMLIWLILYLCFLVVSEFSY